MESQCNSCGASTDRQCIHCPALICLTCKVSHEQICEANQKRKRRGEGPTIVGIPQGEHRRGHEIPPTTEPDRRFSMPAVLGAPYNLNEPPISNVDATKGGLWAVAASLEPSEPESGPIVSSEPEVAPESTPGPLTADYNQLTEVLVTDTGWKSEQPIIVPQMVMLPGWNTTVEGTTTDADAPVAELDTALGAVEDLLKD